MTKRFTNELIVGFVVTFSLVLGYFGYLTIKGKNFFTEETHVYVVVDKIEGVAYGSKVMANGFAIGEVDGVSSIGIKLDKFLIKIKLYYLYDIPINSIVRIKKGLLEDSELLVALGDSQDNLKPEDTLYGGATINFSQQFLESQDEGNASKLIFSTIEELRGVTKNLYKIFDEKFVDNTATLSSNLVVATKEIITLSQKINASYDNSYQKIEYSLDQLDKMISSLANQDTTVIQTLQNVRSISQEIKQANIGLLLDDLKTLTNSVNIFFEKLSSPNTGYQKLILDTSFAYRLDSISRHLDDLIIDVKANPRKYIHIDIFGGKKK